MILDHWRWRCENRDRTIVLPDGCRDLICRHADGEAPLWSVSPLFDRATTATVASQTTVQGWRLKAGTVLDENALLSALGQRHPDEVDTAAMIATASHPDDSADEALEAIARCNTRSIEGIARTLGVTPRTLQRHLRDATGRSPTYWRSLCRIRRCARAILSGSPLSVAAADAGYADQSHMTRECRRWLGVAPGTLKVHEVLAYRLQDSGIGDNP